MRPVWLDQNYAKNSVQNSRFNFKTRVPAVQKLGPRPVIKSSTNTSTTRELSRDIDGSLVWNKPNNLVFFTGFCLLGSLEYSIYFNKWFTYSKTLAFSLHNSLHIKHNKKIQNSKTYGYWEHISKYGFSVIIMLRL